MVNGDNGNEQNAPAVQRDAPSRADARTEERPQGGPRPRGGFGGGGGGGGGRGRFGRRKVCAFCVDKIEHIDYKDGGKLRRYITDRGKIEPRRKTGTCARHQRRLTIAIKRARHIALLPFTGGHARVIGGPSPFGRADREREARAAAAAPQAPEAAPATEAAAAPVTPEAEPFVAAAAPEAEPATVEAVPAEAEPVAEAAAASTAEEA